ncbi:restriction endonuclease [Neolewinella antarctica]|uniref:Type III restriction enzyme n=1 Tax=Neolewinella antarctica TaxID=442734 RepID=A0ABX0XDP9_9BACT|nr:DEAD/DEAH box helicase family protein [Neolewinella antarctica]NJC27034.1 type III restriction enzyme [Neolewinella antarctica]
MKLKFQSDLAYQEAAINAITGLFDGQNMYESRFTVTKPLASRYGSGQMQMSGVNDSIGYGNKLELTPEELLRNVQHVQRSNHLPVSSDKEVREMEFNVEMETGTGKTYVYLRSMLELNQQFGFTKFIIVVPNVAIREGVYKSLQITKDHLSGLYDNVPYQYYVYNSKELNQVYSFATSQQLQIMVINIQAFNSENNLIKQKNDKTSLSPLQLIQQTNPIVIVDEPQSANNSTKARAAIKDLQPLAIFNYSATHKRDINLLYRLDAVAAYQQKLVKQIEVASVVPEGFENEPYVKLIKVAGGKNLYGQVEVFVREGGKSKKKNIQIRFGDSLELLTDNDVYRDNWNVSDIGNEKGKEYVEFMNHKSVTIAEPISSFPETEIRRFQIRQTIQEHLDKEKRLNKRGLKVLSLFFIDSVANYRVYDNEGNASHGPFAQVFEEEYTKLIQSRRYRDLWEDEIANLASHVSEVHDGYFSKDRKSKASNKKDKFDAYKDTKGTTRADNDTYELIMKDKERLLSMDNPLRFIFSHSALKEGWDNPNVFQICTLKDAGSSEIRRRQEVGRGLRLAVNQDGERVYGHEINTLTVMASESYEEFVAGLQDEMEADASRKFGVVDKSDFAIITFTDPTTGELVNITKKDSTILWTALRAEDYLSASGKVTDTLRQALKDESVVLPENYQPEEMKEQVYAILKRKAGSLEIKNSKNRKAISVKKEVLLSPEFKELWDRIKYKSRYWVDYDEPTLVRKCVEVIQRDLHVFSGLLRLAKARVDVTEAGVSSSKESEQLVNPQMDATFIPDIIGYLQNEVNLTRKTLIDIIKESNTVRLIRRNPQQYVQQIVKIIKDTMAGFIVDGIKYERIGENYYWQQELFKDEELGGFLESNLTESTKSPYEYVIYDSKVEQDLVRDMEISQDVKLYAKLPSWFKIDTPLGSYNPDWAVLLERDGEEKLYFVVESKGSVSELDLRDREKFKIECGRRHFAAVGAGVEFRVVAGFGGLSG